MSKLKKQEIIDITIDLFAEHGISNVSVAMIAKALGASKGKVYHYFKNGKRDIVTEMLKSFEQCVNYHMLDNKDWVSENTDMNEILCSLFIEFPIDDTPRIRKMMRIIMSEMYYDAQIAHHVFNHLFIGREKMLTQFFASLIEAGKVSPLDAESTARCLNRLILVYAIVGAMQCLYEQDESKFKKYTDQMIHDCINLIHLMVYKGG